MTAAAAFIAAAAAEIGYVETPVNRTKFAAEAGHINGQPWCATFIVAIARRCGLHLPSASAYTPSLAAAFQKANAWHTADPRPGDLVFFDFPDSVHRIQHVGIVEHVHPTGALTTIEGNTSSGDAGSQANGGGVYRRFRTRSAVVGFGRPTFEESTVPVFPEVVDFSGTAPSHYPAGIVGAVRYIAPRRADGTRRPKCITETELAAHRAAGRQVGFVFEDSALNTSGGAAQGDKDGKRAAAEMIVLDVPPHIGVAVFAAVDRDETSADLPTVAAYLDAFHRHTTAAGYRRGVYGELDVVDTMLRDGHADIGWQTVAWSGKDAGGRPLRSHDPRVVLYQTSRQITLDGTSCDVNDVLAADWGQWNLAPHANQQEDDMRPIAATPSWCHRQPNGAFPQFRAIANDDASTTIVSVDNAPFAPAWSDGRNNSGVTDFAFFGLWCRKFPNTGQPYGFGEADGSLFLIAEHGTYDIAHG